MSTQPAAVDPRRITRLNSQDDRQGSVVYWMSRDQRVADNWALLFAAQKAGKLRQPLEVVFTLSPTFLGASWRQYDFMFRGLREVEASLRQTGIPLTVLAGEPAVTFPAHAASLRAGAAGKHLYLRGVRPCRYA